MLVRTLLQIAYSKYLVLRHHVADDNYSTILQGILLKPLMSFLLSDAATHGVL